VACAVNRLAELTATAPNDLALAIAEIESLRSLIQPLVERPEAV
jgi:hypothetical protein